MSLNHLATRFTCSWPWSTLVLLCDGRVVCGCADPYGQRPLGDARTHRLAEIWRGDTADTLRRDLNAGGSTFCGDCPLKLPLTDADEPPARSLEVGPWPSRLFVECTAACNLSCTDACCAPETGITRTRQSGMPVYRLADLAAHGDLLVAARDDARLILVRRPAYKTERGRALLTLLYLFQRDAAIG